MAGAVSFSGDGFSAKAAGDLSALQFRFMKISAANTVDKATAATDTLIGVLQNKPNAAGKAASVKVIGGSKLQVDATTDIAAGDKLTSDANGKGIKTTTDTHHVGAIALEAATNDGEIISVMLVNYKFAG